jgi:hypothetical protein
MWDRHDNPYPLGRLNFIQRSSVAIAHATLDMAIANYPASASRCATERW